MISDVAKWKEETFSRIAPHLNEGDDNLDKIVTQCFSSDDDFAETWMKWESQADGFWGKSFASGNSQC